jgi:cytochrome P450
MEMHADDEFSTSFDYASGGTAERFQNPLWQVTEIFFGSKLRKSIKIVKDFGQRIVSKAVRDGTCSSSKVKEVLSQESGDKLDQISGSLIQSLLDAIGNEEMAADAALTYLSAGRDTTGQALTWTFYLLMRNPEVTAKVRQEVLHCLSEQQEAQEMERPNPTSFNPISAPYTMAVFYEALRLFPPIPFEIRQCTQDATLPDGTFLPKDSVLVWCLWAMQRSKITWGENADDFRPERFLSEDGSKAISRSTSEFPVFNGGPRTCLGKKMAEAIAVQVIATMAWLFDFAPLDDGERVSKSSLTMPMEGGLPVVVKARSMGAEIRADTAAKTVN